MFKPSRIFSYINPQTGVTEWYFQAREGNMGPYASKAQAEGMLKDFVARCMANGNDGGRDGNIFGLSLAPMSPYDTYLFDSGRTKKGLNLR
jgi:hypothetical protein